MGMSASQARLLSITSRLTNNEFHAQTITDAKLRNADKSIEAGEDYMEALQSKQLMFMNYDDNGEAVKTPLTPAVLYDYAPMKNQYILRNTGDKVLITNLDAKNFAETNNLYEFLDRYGLVEGIEKGIKYDIDVEEPEEVNDIDVEYPPEYRQDLYDKFLYASKMCLSEGWGYFAQKAGIQEGIYNDSKGNPIMKFEYGNWWFFKDGQWSRTGDYQHFGYNCISHVFTHMLKTGDYETTTGETVNINDIYYLQSELGIDAQTASDEANFGYSHWWKSSNIDNRGGLADELANIIAKGNFRCCAEEPVDITESSTDGQKLISDYYIDENGEIKIKSLMQKIVDLDYLNHHQKELGVTNEEMFYAIEHFIDHDLRFIIREQTEKVEEDEIEHEYHKNDEPDEVIVNDQPKAQWYVNLWHALNGSDTANVVEWKQLRSSWDTDAEYAYKVTDKEKSIKQISYEVYDLNLFTSTEWLKFALEQGVVSIEQAQYFNPAEDSLKVMELTSKGYKWNNIIYKSARDFVSQEDETAIMKAEVLYKKRLRDIKDLDTKFDQQLKKLDVEHNALQTEYDSIKEVLSKNVDRSFKAFS